MAAQFQEFIRGPEYQLAAKKVKQTLKEFYDRYGMDSKAEIDACISSTLQDLMSGTLGSKIHGQVSRVAQGVSQGLATAATKLARAKGSKAKVLGTVAKATNTVVSAARYGNELIQLCSLSTDFFNHLDLKLARLDKAMNAKVRNGTYKIDVNSLKQQQVDICFADVAKKDMEDVDDQLHEAFKMKIRQGFLQPAVQGLMNMAMKSVTQVGSSLN